MQRPAFRRLSREVCAVMILHDCDRLSGNENGTATETNLSRGSCNPIWQYSEPRLLVKAKIVDTANWRSLHRR
jgi:hypothetical protein